jgi:hypothetical protein
MPACSSDQVSGYDINLLSDWLSSIALALMQALLLYAALLNTLERAGPPRTGAG